MSVGEALCPRDVFEVPRGLLLVAGPADRGQALGIVDLIVRLAKGERRAVVVDEEPKDQPLCRSRRSDPPGAA
jgi:hypothetical protein